MTIEQFKALYSSTTKCIATYRKGSSELKGVVLDSATVGVAGLPFVFIDSFANRIMLADITDLKDTGTTWGK